jgi:hypothetical protein
VRLRQRTSISRYCARFHRQPSYRYAAPGPFPLSPSPGPPTSITRPRTATAKPNESWRVSLVRVEQRARRSADAEVVVDVDGPGARLVVGGGCAPRSDDRGGAG